MEACFNIRLHRKIHINHTRIYITKKTTKFVRISNLCSENHTIKALSKSRSYSLTFFNIPPLFSSNNTPRNFPHRRLHLVQNDNVVIFVFKIFFVHFCSSLFFNFKTKGVKLNMKRSLFISVFNVFLIFSFSSQHSVLYAACCCFCCCLPISL